MTRIGIYGGTFSPIHNGHVAAAKAFMEQMWLDVLFIMPAGMPPHKSVEGEVSPVDRLKMCELAFADTEGVIISDLELRRSGKSYTVDTLRELTQADSRLFLLLGTDMLLSLDEWREPEEIFKLCYPVYIRRERDAVLDELIIKKIAEYQRKYGKVVRRIITDPITVSSTEIRRAISAGEDISDRVPSAVADYIVSNKLYV